MICPKCAAAEKTSTIRPNYTAGSNLGANATTEVFYGPDGTLHQHSSGEVTTHWICSQGHKLRRLMSPPCPSCGYGGKDHIEVDS